MIAAPIDPTLLHIISAVADNSTWASLGRAGLYLGGGFIIIIFILQYMWARTCKNNIQLLIAQTSGGGKFELAPKEGGSVTIHNKVTDEDRTWAINELATIDVLYPGLGFIPEFLQKTIRMAIVNEGDWEPLLNRSPHRSRVASPDVMEEMLKLLSAGEDGNIVWKDHPKLAEIKKYMDTVQTAPTREMIADPSFLGNLLRNSVMKALATVSNELTEQMKELTAQLTRIKGSSTLVVVAVVGVAVSVILSVVILVMVKPYLAKIDAIGRAQGVLDSQNKIIVTTTQMPSQVTQPVAPAPTIPTTPTQGTRP